MSSQDMAFKSLAVTSFYNHITLQNRSWKPIEYSRPDIDIRVASIFMLADTIELVYMIFFWHLSIDLDLISPLTLTFPKWHWPIWQTFHELISAQ